MQNLLKEYDERKQEIECYYKFLEKIVLNPNIFANTQNKRNNCLNNRIVKILKANTFLLLYNLIESTVGNSVDYVCREITKENIKYDIVAERLKIQWVKILTKQQFKSSNEDKLVKSVKGIIDKTMEDCIKFENNYKISYGSNVNTELLFSIARDFGFELKFAPSLKGGHRINEIKDKRNGLAHGNILFSDCGQNTSIEDLKLYKDDTYKVLKKFLREVKTCVIKKKYKVEHSN